MKTENYFTDLILNVVEEGKKSNPFMTAWQLVRNKVKKIKNVDEKIKNVKDFLNENPSAANFKAVANWTRMTKLGYKTTSPESGQKFEDFLDYLQNNQEKYKEEVEDIDLNDVPEKEFKALYLDLVNRENNFQHGGKRPAAMVAYLARMVEVASDRGIDLDPDPQAKKKF
jgi:hypothetical protein